MAKLFIGNCTKQNHHIYYRLDVMADGQRTAIERFMPAKKSPLILAGRQIALHGDLHMSQIESIVDQLNRYGLAGTVDIPRLNGVVPWLFSIDVPITAAQMKAVMQHNAGVLVNDGKARREAAAIAASDVVQNAGAQDQIDTTQFEVSVEQIEDENTSGPLLGEGFRVASDIAQVPAARRVGRPRKAA